MIFNRLWCINFSLIFVAFAFSAFFIKDSFSASDQLSRSRNLNLRRIPYYHIVNPPTDNDSSDSRNDSMVPARQFIPGLNISSLNYLFMVFGYPFPLNGFSVVFFPFFALAYFLGLQIFFGYFISLNFTGDSNFFVSLEKIAFPQTHMVSLKMWRFRIVTWISQLLYLVISSADDANDLCTDETRFFLLFNIVLYFIDLALQFIVLKEVYPLTN